MRLSCVFDVHIFYANGNVMETPSKGHEYGKVFFIRLIFMALGLTKLSMPNKKEEKRKKENANSDG